VESGVAGHGQLLYCWDSTPKLCSISWRHFPLIDAVDSGRDFAASSLRRMSTS